MNLDTATEKPIYTMTSAGDFSKIDSFKAIWNMDRNELACIASKGYNLIQHKDVVGSLLTALKNLNINYEAKYVQNKHMLIFDVSFPDAKIQLKEVGEEFISGIRLINSYNKTSGLLILPRVTRLACKNGMITNLFMKSYSIRHNQEMVKDFENLIEKAINEIISSNDALKKYVNECIGESVEWQFAEKFLKGFIKSEKHIKGIKDHLKLEEGKNMTKWDLYNAITSYATHGAQIKPNIEIWLSNRAQTVLTKKLAEIPLPKAI